MQEGLGGALPFASSLSPLRARIVQVAAASPLLPWALQPTAQPKQGQTQLGQAECLDGAAPVPLKQQEQQPQGGVAPGESETETGHPDAPAAPGLEQDAALQQQRKAQGQPAQQPPTSAPAQPGARQAAGAVADGPTAAVAGGSARVAALLELLQELQMGCHLSGQRRQVALVAGSRESAAVLLQLVASAQELKTAEVCLLEDTRLPTPFASAGSAGGGSFAGSASHGAAGKEDAVASGGSGGSNPAPGVDVAGSEPGTAGRSGAEEQLGEDAAAGAEPAGNDGTASEGRASPATAAEAAAAGGDAGQRRPAGGLSRSASATEAAVAAAWAQAAPSVRVGRLVVHVLTTAELPALEHGIAGYHSLVW